MMKKIAGIFIVSSVFIFLFTMTALEQGFVIALAEWGIAIIMSALLFLGMSLLK